MSGGSPRSDTEPAAMLSFAGDRPNIASLAGLLCATLGVYFAIRGVYPAAMIALMWAVVLDWADGRIARRMHGRSVDQAAFGAQLDSLIDVISFSVAPAVLLLSIGTFSPWFLPGAFVVLATGVIRLSYFNVFGLRGGSYRGLALDNNVLILGVLFLVEPAMGRPAFSVALYVVLMVLAVLNVAPITTPKPGGRWFYVVGLYALLLSGTYSLQLF